MNPFQAYLQLGWEHILDPKGYDHMLFLVALLAVYTYRDWKPILILVTAFTLGHTLTLVLTGLKGPILPGDWVEFLIPLTILLTVVTNLWFAFRSEHATPLHRRYLLAGFFGLIHGMGFSNFFASLLGRDAAIIKPLFGFNVGIELGQLCFVALLLLVQFLVLKFTPVTTRIWNLVLSGAAGVVALILLIEKFPL
jgi:hypothetical protein